MPALYGSIAARRNPITRLPRSTFALRESKGRSDMSTRRTRTSLFLVAFLILTAVATTAAASDRHAPTRATKTVKAIVTHWSPTTVRISKGDTIKWKAVSGTHTVTAYGNNWTFNHNLATGQVEDRTFRHAGTFRFRCSFHSTLTNGHCTGMCGKVVVRG
jgi:plastocyanin